MFKWSFFTHEISGANKTNEAITSEMVGQAHVEQKALEYFVWADTQDRASVFNKNVVKAFYTAGHLFDVLTVFPQGLDEENKARQKYAKWKAAYIHNCLKTGQVPKPGPEGDDGMAGPSVGFEGVGGGHGGPSSLGSGGGTPSPKQSRSPSPKESKPNAPDALKPRSRENSGSSASRVNYDAIAKAQKHCKFAMSALDYEDVEGAVKELHTALNLLEKK